MSLLSYYSFFFQLSVDSLDFSLLIRNLFLFLHLDMGSDRLFRSHFCFKKVIKLFFFLANVAVFLHNGTLFLSKLSLGFLVGFLEVPKVSSKYIFCKVLRYSH